MKPKIRLDIAERVAALLAKDFDALGFVAPDVVVGRRSDGCKGSLEFQHLPRFHFNFVLD